MPAEWLLRSLLVLSLAAPLYARAQTPSFPADGDWITVKDLGCVVDLHDSALDTATGIGTGSRDLVSDTEPTVQAWADEFFVYFRIRVDATPNPPGLDGFGWGCQVSTDGNASRFEWMAFVDGKGGTADPNAVVRVAQAPPVADSPSDVSTLVGASYAGSTHVLVQSDSSSDFFVEFAVPRDRLALSCSPPVVTVVCGANSNAAASLTTGNSGDIAGVGNVAVPTWAQAASCPVVLPGKCEAGGQLCDPQGQCVDCLGDADCTAEQFCVSGSCVGCASNTDCDLPASPTCTAGACGPCTAKPPEERDAACIDDDNGAQIQACHEITGECVECRNDGHCADNGSNDVCDTSSSTCGECNVNEDCAEPTPVCDTSGLVNVCIFVDQLVFADGFED